MSGESPRHSSAEDEPPPLGSWARLYTLVLAWLGATILLLTWLTRSFD